MNAETNQITEEQPGAYFETAQECIEGMAKWSDPTFYQLLTTDQYDLWHVMVRFKAPTDANALAHAAAFILSNEGPEVSWVLVKNGIEIGSVEVEY